MTAGGATSALQMADVSCNIGEPGMFRMEIMCFLDFVINQYDVSNLISK